MFKEELIIIRHGRSAHNVRQSDDLDSCLTDYGLKQAKNVGVFLSKHMNLNNFKYFTSPFLRCLQTAQGINNSLRQQWQVDQNIREYLNHSGNIVIIPNRNNDYTCPEFIWGDYPDRGVFYKEEWNEVFLDRIAKFYDSLPEKSVVVTHGLPAMQLMHIGTSLERVVPLWDMSIDNCSITYIVKGRIIWRGRNLYHEIDGDPFDKSRPYDFKLN